MKKAETKKVFVFIVEGWSDSAALERILRKIYTNRAVYTVVTEGDITSDDRIPVTRVEAKIYEVVKKRIDEDKIRFSDIASIIQICDTDGAFIPDTSIVSGESVKFTYSPTEIRTSKVSKAIGRNQKKREKINHLLETKTIKNIPYRLFFMSSNLDHVLYDIQNLEDDKKVSYADAFYEKYKNCAQDFIEFIESVAFGVPDSFIDSWKFIKTDLHSLERHNNLFICFSEHPPFAQ